MTTLARTVALAPPVRYALQSLAVAAACLAAARLGLTFSDAAAVVPATGAAAGVAVAALVLLGLQLAPGVFLGVATAALTARVPFATAAFVGLGDTLAACAGAWLLTRVYDFRPALVRVRDVLLLIFPIALGMTALAATIGMAALLAAGIVSVAGLESAWFVWWSSAAQGVLFGAPAILTWATQWRPARTTAFALLTAVAAAAALLFAELVVDDYLGQSATQYLVSFALFPLAVWPAVRFRMRDVALYNVVLATLFSIGAAGGIGPLGGYRGAGELLALHGLLTLVGLTTLLICAGITERRDAAARLRESEARFRSLTELSADWYWEQDAEFRFTLLSPEFNRRTGVDERAFLGKRRWELPFLDRESPVWAEHRRLIEAHLPFRNFLISRLGADGAIHYGLTSGEPFFDERGRFCGYRGVGREITTQKRGELALQESRELFASLFHANPQPTVLWRLGDGVVMEVNDAWCQLTNLARAEVLGHPLSSFGHVDDDAARRRVYAELEEHGRSREIEIQYRATGKGLRQMLFSGAVVEMRGERVVISTLTDITERNRVQNELALSKARFEHLFRASPQPVAISGIDDGRVIDVSEMWTRTYGYTREEVLGKNFIELGLWIDLDVREAVRAQLQATGAVKGSECRWRRKGGDIADVLFYAEVVVLGGERVMLSTGMDITERRRQERLLAESERRFATIFRSSPVPVVISRLQDGRYLEVNDAWTSFFGYSRAEILGKTSVSAEVWLSPADREDFLRAIGDGQPLRELEVRFRKKSGEIADVLVSSEPIELEGEPCLLTSVMDISERKRAERAMRESERRFRDFAEAAGEYVWELDAEGRYTFLSRRVESVLGYPREELYGRHPAEFMPPGEDTRMRDWYAATLASRQAFRNVEHRSLGRTGSQVWQSMSGVPIIDAEGRLTGYRGTALDITERKRTERRITDLATRDPLTGLPNRLLLNDRIAQGIVGAQREGRLLALMFIDLDHFKSVNDTLGHDVGDLLLKEVAQRIGVVLRKGDTLSRLGGDEFVVLLEDLKTAEDAGQVGQKIIDALTQEIDVAGNGLHTGASIGIAVYPSDGADASALMRHADTAMYVAKSSGRHNYQFFSAEMNTRATERLRIEAGLRRALERNELRLHYQPRVEVATDHLTAVEALLRWRHPEHGLLKASQFMRSMEATGLAHAFGEWVLRNACNQAASLHAVYGPAFALSVNVSPSQLSASLVARVKAALDESSLDPQLLELDLPESALTRNPEEARTVLARLRKLGVRIVIDDFGSGYSSLGELRRYGIDGIKIDRQLVHGMAASADDRIVVKAMIDMARSLRINTIAEGVESKEQLAMLREMGCEEYLGHLHAEPLPPDELERRFLRLPNVVNFPRRR